MKLIKKRLSNFDLLHKIHYLSVAILVNSIMTKIKFTKCGVDGHDLTRDKELPDGFINAKGKACNHLKKYFNLPR
jgi:hypothetical protein